MDNRPWESQRPAWDKASREETTVWLGPVSESNVVTTEAADIGHDGEDEENDEGQEFEHAEVIFQFTVHAYTQKSDH